MPVQNPLAAVWQALTALLIRDRDMGDWQNARLAAIEDRLAAMDSGSDANEARLEAVAEVNARRTATGADPLAFRLADKGDRTRLEWVDPRAKHTS